MFKPKVSLPKGVLEKAKRASEASGCASLEEYIEKIVERDADKVLSQTAGNKELSKAEVDDIANKLKGLGYLE